MPSLGFDRVGCFLIIILKIPITKPFCSNAPTPSKIYHSMKGIIAGGRHGMRAFRTIAVKCSTQMPAGGGKAPQGPAEGAKRVFSSLLPSSLGSKRSAAPKTPFRLFSSSSGGGGAGGVGGSSGGGSGGGGGGGGGLWVAYLALLNRRPVRLV